MKTDSHDNDSSATEFHAGYDLESGVLGRVREWTDLLPWLRLGRTLRAAGSPPLLLSVALTVLVWTVGSQMLSRHDHVSGPPQLSIPGSLAGVNAQFVATIGQQVQQALPTSLFWSIHQGESFWRSVGQILWALIVWMPVTLMLIRQGALLTAGRPMMNYASSLKLAVRRSPIAWLLACVPLACVAVVGIAIIVLGWVSRMGAALEFPVGLAVALVAIVCGVLAFGANVAVPLGWSALINEKEPDALDSLSRGYEYLYRRPLQLTMYVIVGLVCLLIITYLSHGISIAGVLISDMLLSVSGGDESIRVTTQAILLRFPLVVAITLFWALVGGVYLLLRQDAGGQEVEDIWQPSEPPPTPLPKLKT